MTPPGRAGAGLWLLRAFRSVAVVIEQDAASGDVLPDIPALADWIGRWNAWFRQAAGLDFGEGLHLQYRRDAVVVTDLDFAGLLATRPAGWACRDAGIGFGASILLSSGLAHRAALLDLLAEGWLQALTLVHDLPAGSTETVLPFVEAVFATDMQIRLAGSPAAFLRDGVLESPILNARHVTIDPRSPVPAADPAFRRQPCLPLMRIHVDSTGYLYSCLGLLGLEAGRLGHIDDPLEDTVLGGRASPLDLATLAAQGPALAQGDRPVRALGLPAACEHHRSAILSASAD